MEADELFCEWNNSVVLELGGRNCRDEPLE